MDDKYQLQFVWPYREPNDVVVTGDFDGWNSSVHLERTERGFEASVPVDWNSKVRFKFRTDGWWTTIANFPTEVDDLGNVNNITFIPEKPAAKTNGVAPTKEVIEAREVTPAVPETTAAVPEPASETPAVEEFKPAVDTPAKTEVVLPVVEVSAEPASDSSPAAPTTNGTPLESDKVEPPVAEEPEVAPAVPIVILPVAEKQADANDAHPTVDEVPSTTPVPEEAPVPPSTHVPAPAPEPEPVPEPEVKADASEAQPTTEVAPPSAPKPEETPAEAPSPAPALEVTEPKTEEKAQPVAEATPIPAETPKAPKAPSTPPRQISQLPGLPSTPVKQTNGTAATSVPSTPQSGPTVSASAPATPAGKLAFPSEGKDEAGSVRSLKEGHHKHRLSFLKKIKNKIHDRLHPHHHDGTESPKGNGQKDKEGSLFNRRSSSKY